MSKLAQAILRSKLPTEADISVSFNTSENVSTAIISALARIYDPALIKDFCCEHKGLYNEIAIYLEEKHVVLMELHPDRVNLFEYVNDIISRKATCIYEVHNVEQVMTMLTEAFLSDGQQQKNLTA